MKRRGQIVSTSCGLAVVVVATWWLSTARGEQEPPHPSPTTEQNMMSGCLQVVSRPGEPLVAVVYDPAEKVLGVYHIDHEGGIALKGIRPIRWDLRMLHFNGKAPLPEDVRNGLTR